MKYLNITDEERQKHIVTLENGEKVVITMKYNEKLLSWTGSVEYGTFKLELVRFCNLWNILYKYKEALLFGIKIYATDDRRVEPVERTAFSSGRVKFAILNEDDLAVQDEFFADYRNMREL